MLYSRDDLRFGREVCKQIKLNAAPASNINMLSGPFLACFLGSGPLVLCCIKRDESPIQEVNIM